MATELSGVIARLVSRQPGMPFAVRCTRQIGNSAVGDVYLWSDVHQGYVEATRSSVGRVYLAGVMRGMLSGARPHFVSEPVQMLMSWRAA